MNKQGVILFFLFIIQFGSAQLRHPKVSPAATIEQEVGLSKITISYSRPAVRGREIFGELVPYGRIWRVGANESTKVTVDADVVIKDNTLEKGTYALYAFPSKEQWQIIFHKNISHWGDGRKKYNPEEDVFRIQVIPQREAKFHENLSIYFDKLTHDSTNLIIHWANTSVTIPIQVKTGKIMEKLIQEKLQNDVTAQTYYEVARYYVEEQIKHQLAIEYLKKAIELAGDTYYFYRVKSLAEAALGHYELAIIAAKKSLELAQKEDKDEFVRMNQKNISMWTRLLKEKNE